MFGLAATFLAGPYGFLLKIAAVVAVVAGLYLYGYKSGRDSMQPRVEAAESATLLWQETAKNRLTLMQAQNTAVAALKTAQDTRLKIQQQKLAEARIEADKWRDTAERRADLLANLELPENECQALTVLIDEARK